MKAVFVEKDQHPVTIMQMAHINDPVLKKAVSFENLCGTAVSFGGTQYHRYYDLPYSQRNPHEYMSRIPGSPIC